MTSALNNPMTDTARGMWIGRQTPGLYRRPAIDRRLSLSASCGSEENNQGHHEKRGDASPNQPVILGFRAERYRSIDLAYQTFAALLDDLVIAKNAADPGVLRNASRFYESPRGTLFNLL